MFTGIIEETGALLDLKLKNSDWSDVSIRANKVLGDAKVGDSIAVNGVCLTVEKIGNDFFSASIMQQTRHATTFEYLKKNDLVNLERALKADGRLGGHFVTGHVDGVGEIKSIEKKSGNYQISIEVSHGLINYFVKKGSVACDGISLTVMDVFSHGFMVSLIPQTLEETNMRLKKVGDKVNIETDILGKYILKNIGAQSQGLTIDKLKEYGF